MRIKKSMFAKLLALAIPMAAISIITPVILTSCGSSNTLETSKTQASWDTDKTQSGLSFNTTDNSAVITLDDTAFAGTSISKASKLADIQKSLDPSSTGISLYSVLSGAIKNVNNYNVKLSIATNPVVFDYSNDAIGNYFNGEFQLTPKSGTNISAVNLNFRVNNFNDSYNGESGKDLTWDVNAIETALKKDQANSSPSGNSLPDVKPIDNGASVTIDLSKQSPTIGLGQVMDELCKSTVTMDELKNFITNNNNVGYDFSKASISSWAPTVDGTKVFTRIVVPTKAANGQSAILYIAYIGFKKDDGNGVWNRNISYPGGVNLWDSKWKEPVIDLSKVTSNIGNSSISNNSTYNDITDKEIITPLAQYMKDNYIIDSNNFTFCFTGVKGGTSTENTIVPGSFNEKGEFVVSADNVKNTKDAITKDSSSSNPLSGKQAVEIKIYLTSKNGTSADKPDANGIWRSFYLINYKTTSSSN